MPDCLPPAKATHLRLAGTRALLLAGAPGRDAHPLRPLLASTQGRGRAPAGRHGAARGAYKAGEIEK
jgi:hypothetical protein